MSDFGWLSEIGKYLGGGVAGWIGRIVTERNKARKTRKRLYRELAANLYWVHIAFVDYVRATLDRSVGVPDVWNHDEEAFRQKLANIRLSYFEHAAKDMDTVHALPDYDALLKAFGALSAVRLLDPWSAKTIDLVDAARERGHEVVALCRSGRLDKKELLRHLSEDQRTAIEPMFVPEAELNRSLRADAERRKLAQD